MRMRNKMLLVAAMIAFSVPSANADLPDASVYVGIYGGGHLSFGDWSMGDIRSEGVDLEDAGVVGLRLGGQFLQWLSLEAHLGYLPGQSGETTRNDINGNPVDVAERSAHILDYGGMLRFMAPMETVGIYLGVGGGGYTVVGGDIGEATDWHADAALGAQIMLHDLVAMRIEARHIFTPGVQDEAYNFELTLGFDFFAWRTEDDRDGDGIDDEVDACPDTPGVESAKGCPDKDGDGIADSTDECPDVAGPADTGGCPDKDGDKIKDSADRCPEVPGVAEFKGCPDTDNDSIADPDDKCPKVPGIAQFNGCPDTDKDGIQDSADKCPKQPGPAKTQGCPDADGDGIADSEDKCPKVFGLVENQGCLPKVVAEKFQGAMKGIYFKTGKSDIKKQSFKVLDEAIAIMNQYKSVRVRVEGHTDDRGSDEKNLELSQARAASVKTYLVSKGIAADRIDSAGFGETKPIASNKTGKGRAENRRIEFRVITR